MNEKKQKKSPFLVITIVLIVGIIAFFGILTKVENNKEAYKTIVKNGLRKYYKEGESREAKEIVKLLNKYENNDEMIDKIQKYSVDIINGWILNINDKYKCDQNNKNACKVAITELENVKTKINNLGAINSDNKSKIISSIEEQAITNSILQKEKEYKAIANAADAKRPLTYAEEAKLKCDQATNCTNCYNGYCACDYTNENGAIEKVNCKAKNTTN